jgi:hypothetical protein
MKLVKLSILAILLGAFTAGCNEIDSAAGDHDKKGTPDNIPQDTLASGTNAMGVGTPGATPNGNTPAVVDTPPGTNSAGR